MHDFVRRAAIFHALQDDAVNALLALSTPVPLPRRRVIFTEGQDDDRLFIIESGVVKLGRNNADGQQALVGVMGPSDVFGELAVFDTGPRSCTATSVTAVHAVSFDANTVRRWIGAHPEVAESFLRLLARRLRRTNETVSDQIYVDAAGRVAKQLLHLARRFGVRQGDGLRVAHGLSQVEIAHLAGSTRETVNKALVDFTARGWIAEHGQALLIIDTERLARRTRTERRPS